MRITAVRPLLLSAPYATPGDAERLWHLRTGYRSAALVVIETDETLHGAPLYGLGETYAGVYAPQAVRALVEQLAADLVGQPADSPLRLLERMQLAVRYWGRMGLSQSVIGGIEMALWDLLGKALGAPVHRLLGGAVHDALPAYASGGNDKPAGELRAEMEGYLADGFRAVKVRINALTHAQMVQKVALCRDALGPDVRLAADAVQGTAPRPWSPKEAIEVARVLEPYDLFWLEEPAEVTAYGSFAEVRRTVATLVAGGETVTSLTEAEAYLAHDALDLFQPDASLIGGLSIFQRVARQCERRGVKVAAHCWSGGVGLMGNYHAAFTAPNCIALECPTVPNPLRDRLMVEPLTLDGEGRIAAPTAPGLGVCLPDGLEAEFPFRPDSWYRVLR